MAGAPARRNQIPQARDAPVQRGGNSQIIDANLLAPSGVKRIVLVGANSTAEMHARILRALKNVRLEGIIDSDLDRARSFAGRHGGIAAASSLRDMLAARPLDAVHVLTSGEKRAGVMGEALALGLSVLAESPLAWDGATAEALAHAAARCAAGALAANHHFLYHPAFAQLERIISRHRLGPLVGLSAVIALPAQKSVPAASGRSADLLLAEAAHPLSQILALAGPVSGWKILAAPKWSPLGLSGTLSIALSGEICEAQFQIRFDPTYPIWQLTAFCTDGVLKADMLRNRVLYEERSRNLGAIDNFLEARRLGHQLLGEARRNLLAHGRALLGLRGPRGAVEKSLADAITAFYRRDLHAVSTPKGAAQIVRLCEAIAADAFPAPPIRAHAPASAPFRADAVVLGGTGFLGRHIVRAFARRGLNVAALSRSPAQEQGNQQIRFVQGNILDGDGLARLSHGARFLINATALDRAFGHSDYELRSQAVTANLLACCRRAGIARLVHLSSLDALYLGDKYDVITGRAPVDPYDWQRDPWARAKGLEEIALLTAYEEERLPVTILRPGIALGEGGTPYPEAVGQFVNVRHCLGWNRGNNPLPFVLAEDVASAVLAAAEREGVLGHCFNLVGDVRLTARDYVACLSQVLGRPFEFHSRLPDLLYMSERMKAGLPRRPDREGPFCSRRELASRGMIASFDCSDTKAALAWSPVADRQTFIARGIGIHAVHHDQCP
jgi:nucleoside-diphosphate-sugar epimerase/predicted dehydrogenase